MDGGKRMRTLTSDPAAPRGSLVHMGKAGPTCGTDLCGPYPFFGNMWTISFFTFTIACEYFQLVVGLSNRLKRKGTKEKYNERIAEYMFNNVIYIKKINLY